MIYDKSSCSQDPSFDAVDGLACDGLAYSPRTAYNTHYLEYLDS